MDPRFPQTFSENVDPISIGPQSRQSHLHPSHQDTDDYQHHSIPTTLDNYPTTEPTGFFDRINNVNTSIDKSQLNPTQPYAAPSYPEAKFSPRFQSAHGHTSDPYSPHDQFDSSRYSHNYTPSSHVHLPPNHNQTSRRSRSNHSDANHQQYLYNHQQNGFEENGHYAEYL